MDELNDGVKLRRGQIKLARQVRQLVNNKRFTRQELAEVTGVSRFTIDRLMYEQNHALRQTTFQQLRRSVDAILRDEVTDRQELADAMLPAIMAEANEQLPAIMAEANEQPSAEIWADTVELELELKALSICIHTLNPLDKTTRQRVLRYLSDRYFDTH